jgi:hypothetical protein
MTRESHGRSAPTRTSVLLATAVASVAVVALLSQVRPAVVPAAVGIAGALCLAAGLGLAAPGRDGTVPTVAASVLTVPVAVGVVVGTVGTSLSLVGAFFPVQTAPQVSARSLLLVARVGVATGCTVAVLGLALGAGNVADPGTLRSHYWLTLRTGVVPAAVGTALAASTMLAGGGNSDPARAGPESPLLWLLSPGTGQTHAASLFCLFAVATLAVRYAVGVLPVVELLADRGGGVAGTGIGRIRWVLGRLAAVGALGAALALVVELSVRPVELRQLVGPAVYRDLVTASTARGLRLPLALVVAVSVLPAVAATVLRRIVRDAIRGDTRWTGPLVGGAVLTAVALAAARPVLDALLGWTAAKLPGPLERTFADTTGPVVAYYGPGTVVVVLAAVLVAVTTTVVLLVRVLLASGYLTEETAGYSLASGGLFVAAAFAGAVGRGRLIAFGGLVAALFVWDLGRYGTVLGREVGRHAQTRTAELVHAGGSLAVGVLGTALAVGFGSLVDGGAVEGSPGTTAALAGVTVGILLLVESLR